jgi:hypothetical protein
MIKKQHIFLLITILLFSCGEKKINSDFEQWNSRMIDDQSEEIKKSFSLLEKKIKDGQDFELTGIYSTLIDFEMDDSPKNPHLVFFIYEIDHKEFMAHFYVDSNDVISLGYNISENNYEDYSMLKDLELNNPNESDKASFIRSFIDPKGFKTIESNYRDWARHMPYIGRWDTLNSNQSINIKKYNEKYLPKGHEIIGELITVGNENEEIFYIIYKVKNSYYLKLINYQGQMKYQRKIFDENFIGLNKYKFSRFYLSDRHINFENCKKTNDKILVVKKDSIGIVDLYDKYK